MTRLLVGMRKVAACSPCGVSARKLFRKAVGARDGERLFSAAFAQRPPAGRDTAGATASAGSFELLAREEEDALVQLAAIRTLRGWLGGRERLSLAAARAQEYTWAEIGAAQGRPRQALQRQASRQAQRQPASALTAPDFVGVATAELEFWLTWWSGGGWTPAGPEKASRDPRREQERIRAELRARERRAGAGGGRDGVG